MPNILARLIRLGIGIILLSLLASMVTGCQPQFRPGTFTDDIGREITYGPRIVLGLEEMAKIIHPELFE